MTKNIPVICPHCNCLTSLRNPSGYCDHLYYPESCLICCNESEIAEQKLSSAGADETPYEQFARAGYAQGFKQGKKAMAEEIVEFIKSKSIEDEHKKQQFDLMKNTSVGKAFRQDDVE